MILTIDDDDDGCNKDDDDDDGDDGDCWSVWVRVTFLLFILPPRCQTSNIWMKMYVVDFYVC